MITYDKFRHTTAIQLRFKDADIMGHINNANHFTYFELARVKYFNDVIAERNDWSQNGFILAKMLIEYVKPVFLTDDIYAMTRCSKIGNKSFELQYVLLKMENNDVHLLAKGESVIVCFDYSKNSSIPVLPEWIEKMKRYEGSI
jgi:acyl-CoA thioester hydrolase